MKKIILSILVVCLLVGCSNKERNDSNEELIQLVKNHFEFKMIFDSPLDYNEITGEVTSNKFSTYSDYENKVRNTYSKEISDKILGENGIYYNVNGKLYINENNANFAGIYTGYKDVNITIKEQLDNKVIFDASVTAYIDSKQNTENVVYNLVALKENNKWLITEGVNFIDSDNDSLDKTFEFNLNSKRHKIDFKYTMNEDIVNNLYGQPCNSCEVSKYILNITLDDKDIKLNNIDVINVLKNENTFKFLKDVKVIKDEKNNKEYIVIYYTTYTVMGVKHNIKLIDENNRVIYFYDKSETFSVTDINGNKIPFVNLINGISVISNRGCNDYYIEKVSVVDGDAKVEKINFSENIKITGGC